MAKKRKEKISLLLYYDYLDSFELLNDKQLRQLIYAMISFDKEEKIQKLDKLTNAVFVPIKKRLLRDKEEWGEKCNRNKENIQKYWDNKKGEKDTNVYDGIRMYTKNTDIDIEIDIEKEIERERDNIYNPPALSEILLFMEELGFEKNELYCKNFIDNYASKKWKGIGNWKVKFEKWCVDDKLKKKKAQEFDTRTFFTDENGKLFKYDNKGVKHYV